MVRTLPWLKQSTQPKSQAGNATAAAAPPDAKRRRVNSISPPPSSTGRSGSVASSTTSSKPQNGNASAVTTAAPKTKPAASADKEYMRAGLAQDDRYIMVEDQLLTVARSLTSTLHSAEYARRKALAASHAPAFPNSIARPTISSAIPGERRMANRSTAHKRQLILANENNKNARLDTSNISSDEDEEEAVKAMLKAEGDNASGTVFAKGALGRLMRTKPTKVERKLDVKTGSSRTRAAAGFKKTNASTPTSQRGTQIDREEAPSSPLRGKNSHRETYENDSKDDAEDDLEDAGKYDLGEDMGDGGDETDGSDGLDVPAPRRQAPKKKISPIRKTAQPPTITKSTRHSHRSPSPRVFGEDEGTGSDDMEVIPTPHTRLQERFEAEESDDMEILPAPSRTKKALSPRRRRPTPPRSKPHHSSSTNPTSNSNKSNNSNNHFSISHIKPPTPVKSILKKKPAIIELSSDSEDMDEAEAERWRRRRGQQQPQQQRHQQQQRQAVKTTGGKERKDDEDNKRNSGSAPLAFLGLKYST